MSTRIFYATDIHGSETCFLKFVNAAAFYGCRILIMGGDITGKLMVPILKRGDGTHRAHFMDRDWDASTAHELSELAKKIRRSGGYPYVCEADELDRLNAEPETVKDLFTRVMVDETRRWMELAEDRLAKIGAVCYITPGNDDELAVDAAFEGGTHVLNPEGWTVQLDDHHEMISTGYANVTPWHCPRDEPEETLRARIEVMASQLTDPPRAIFNFHCPPHDSQLDEAPELDDQLTPVIVAGQLHMIPVGSTAVREAVEQWQPLIGLHGHIHESRGVAKIGRTQCFNPGSEYGSGYLRGLILELEPERVKSYQFTSG